MSFHFGLPAEELLARVRGWGAKILSSATTVDEARWLEAHGVDAIIAQGLEAGGHRGMFLSDDIGTQLGTFALVPQVVGAVKVPVIAAGGIADARGVAAAIALGARGVQVGTAYLLCPEATTSAVHRAALKSDARPHTALTNVFTGRPARGIVNRLMRELGPISGAAPPFPARGDCRRAAARQGGEPGQRRLLAAVGRAEPAGLPGGRRGRHHAGAGRLDMMAAVDDLPAPSSLMSSRWSRDNLVTCHPAQLYSGTRAGAHRRGRARAPDPGSREAARAGLRRRGPHGRAHLGHRAAPAPTGRSSCRCRWCSTSPARGGRAKRDVPRLNVENMRHFVGAG